jgi:hypothetical protein
MSRRKAGLSFSKTHIPGDAAHSQIELRPLFFPLFFPFLSQNSAEARPVAPVFL